MPLTSYVFAGDPKLEACLVKDSAHILTGAKGVHVRKIQAVLEAVDGADIADGEWQTMTYGPSTASAVLDYKTKRSIINKSYQNTADNIVGKMTIAALDKEIRDIETSAQARASSRCKRQVNTDHRGLLPDLRRNPILLDKLPARSPPALQPVG